MTTPLNSAAYREPHSPRRLTQARTQINATTTMVAGMPEFNFAHPKSFLREFKRALLATAIFRSWHFIVLFTLEATLVTYYYQVRHHKGLGIQSTLMNVLGTVLGFVISYRSSASFDRYNEGRRYWSQVVHNVRMFSRVVWFNVPDVPTSARGQPAHVIQEHKARSLVEKKTVLNLLEAYAVSLKHYLRGEEGILYEDLYPLIKFLPAYAPRPGVSVEWSSARPKKANQSNPKQRKKTTLVASEQLTASAESLPANARGRSRSPAIKFSNAEDEKTAGSSSNSAAHLGQRDLEAQTVYLNPSSNPPAWHVFDMWPFYLCIRSLQKSGSRQLGGHMALRDRAQNGDATDNIPLEITLYLSGYISSLSERGTDGLCTGTMMGALGQLVEALTGLERILSTPVPWAYQVHLWTVTLVWLLVLPFQILDTLGWLTIPGTALAAFVYCGLMKCAEELEDPFGYDYNDLNLDHFTHNIVRQELKAITDITMPSPATWAFVPENDAVFDDDGRAIYLHADHLAPPAGWGKRDADNIHTVMTASPVSPSKSSGNAAIGAGVMQASGNHSFGGPGGAGLIAGSAVAAAGLSAMPDMSNSMVNSSNAPMSS